MEETAAEEEVAVEWRWRRRRQQVRRWQQVLPLSPTVKPRGACRARWPQEPRHRQEIVSIAVFGFSFVFSITDCLSCPLRRMGNYSTIIWVWHRISYRCSCSRSSYSSGERIAAASTKAAMSAAATSSRQPEPWQQEPPQRKLRQQEPTAAGGCGSRSPRQPKPQEQLQRLETLLYL